MFSFFRGEPFPYVLGDQLQNFSTYSVFSLFSGRKKGSNDKVSIFTLKHGIPSHSEIARRTIRKLKTLKHPSILRYIDSHEDESTIYLVTEKILPLLMYLEKNPDLKTMEMYLKWGLYYITEAVQFLNDHNQRHNNLFHGSIFVDTSGSWKLGETGYLTSESEPFPRKNVFGLSKYDPINVDGSEALNSDVWGMGMLLWEVFNGELKNRKELKNLEKIPRKLSHLYRNLIKGHFPSPRPLVDVLTECSSDNLFFYTLDNLENYHLRERKIKEQVSEGLMSLLPKMPKDMITNKIFWLLKQAFEFDEEYFFPLVPAVIKMPTIADSDEDFKRSAEQFLLFLFYSRSRPIRLALLTNIEEIINHVNKKRLHEFFPYVSAGFMDENPKIRGETVKAVIHFAPELSSRNLIEDVLRQMVKIQAKDPEVVIRINTTICLTKIAHCLNPDARKKILMTALIQALRDPYSGVRVVGAQSLAASNRFFPLENVAKNVLPALVCLTVDVDGTVRENAFKTIKGLLSKLEKVSEHPEMKEEIERDVSSQTCVESTTTWSTFTGITSKFLKPTDTRLKHPEPESSGKKNIPDHSLVPQSSTPTSYTLLALERPEASTRAIDHSLLSQSSAPSSYTLLALERPEASTSEMNTESSGSLTHEDAFTSLQISSKEEESTLTITTRRDENEDPYQGSDEDNSDWGDGAWGEEVLDSSEFTLELRRSPRRDQDPSVKKSGPASRKYKKI